MKKLILASLLFLFATSGSALAGNAEVVLMAIALFQLFQK